MLETVYILSSVLLVGTGFGSAFYLYWANRVGPLDGPPGPQLAAQAVVARLVVRAARWFTTPAALVQPLSGIVLAHWGEWPLTTPWILASLAMYVLALACWLPVLVLQARMARTAAADLAAGRALDERYRRDARRWEWLGVPAFVAMLGIYALMVGKPALG